MGILRLISIRRARRWRGGSRAALVAGGERLCLGGADRLRSFALLRTAQDDNVAEVAARRSERQGILFDEFVQGEQRT
jgi:hypothetical protein